MALANVEVSWLMFGFFSLSYAIRYKSNKLYSLKNIFFTFQLIVFLGEGWQKIMSFSN